jgi:hypothetical protein
MLVEEKIESVDIVKFRATAKFTAWSKHCCTFYDELVSLLVENKFILAKDIIKASSLVTDIQHRSTQVPFEGKLSDMTDDLYHWISLSVRGHKLKELFLPPE